MTFDEIQKKMTEHINKVIKKQNKLLKIKKKV
jgi:hypothetical protein